MERKLTKEEISKLSLPQFVALATKNLNDRDFIRECDRRIYNILKYMHSRRGTCGIRFDSTLTVKCIDNYEQEYEERIVRVLYDPSNDVYEIQNKDGIRVPYSFIEDPIKILMTLCLGAEQILNSEIPNKD